ncbi:hypothetical protein RSSM_02515 [Rhodopirellula sallentina SM41]|uniref:Uncharacterized protein n=1 Tax=Rhodopirellula sallentina SM41 TaxID=1263870 RepID=M5U3I6_9BACT|nr:hypothetical protein RSSM_02515 [Rhodopirellula sallentina SM41]
MITGDHPGEAAVATSAAAKITKNAATKAYRSGFMELRDSSDAW